MTPEQHLDAHRDAGRFFEADEVRSFVREEGSGKPVVCMHGVPSSCYLYRKVLPELARHGLRGVAFDLPGLGLADRPTDFAYTYSGLGRWATAAVDVLGLDRFHLVIHDIGGPVGLEVAAAMPERILSLTILNTIVRVDGFRKPWVMRPFEKPSLGRLYLATINRFTFARLMYLQGVNDKSKAPPDELAVYVDLLKREDGGAAFLKIMRGFETTAEKERLYVDTIRKLSVPIQFIWGVGDPALPLQSFCLPAMEATGVSTLHQLPAKHFLQEDQAPAIAQHIADLIAG